VRKEKSNNEKKNSTAERREFKQYGKRIQTVREENSTADKREFKQREKRRDL
jgi:hypothetical protein